MLFQGKDGVKRKVQHCYLPYTNYGCNTREIRMGCVFQAHYRRNASKGAAAVHKVKIELDKVYKPRINENMKKIVGSNQMRVSQMLYWKRAIVLMCLCLLMGVSFAYQVWQDPVEISRTDNLMLNKWIALEPGGGYALSWSAIVEGGVQENYLQRFNAQNQPLLENPLLPYNQANNQRCIMARLSNGEFICGLLGLYTNPISFYKVSAQGSPLGLICNIPNNGYNVLPKVIPDSAGGFWVYYYEPQFDARVYKVRHYDSDGTPEASSDTIAISDGQNTSSEAFFVQSDNSLVLSCIIAGDLHLLRITVSGSITMDNVIDNGESQVSHLTTLCDSNGDYIWVYSVNTNSNYYTFHALKTDAEGQLVWQSPVLIESGLAYPPKSWNASLLADNSVMFARVSNSTSKQDYYSVDACNISCNGVIGNIFPAEEFTRNYSGEKSVMVEVVPNASLGAWVGISIDNKSLGSTISEYSFIYANAEEGTWDNVHSLLISDSNPNVGGISIFAKNDDTLIFVTQGSSQGSTRIIKQDIDAAGEITETTIKSSRLAMISWPKTLSLGENIFCTWLERDGPSLVSDPKVKIGYQIISPLGVKLLPSNPAIYPGGETSKLTMYNVLVTPDNEVLIWWMFKNIKEIRAQLIDVAGNELWEPGGKVIYSGPDVDNTGSVYASYWQGQFYFMWQGQFNTEVKGQRIFNSVLMWQLEGRVIVSQSQFNDANVRSVVPAGMDGDYLIYIKGLYNNNNLFNSVQVMQFTEMGLPTELYAPYGINAWSIPINPQPGYFYEEFFHGCYRTSAGLVVFGGIGTIWDFPHNQGSDVSGIMQIFGPEAELLFGAQGYRSSYVTYPLAVTNDFIYCINSIFSQLTRYNASGLTTWRAPISCYIPAAVVLEDGQLMVANAFHHMLYTNSGTQITFDDSNYCTYYDYDPLHRPRMAAVNGYAYVLIPEFVKNVYGNYICGDSGIMTCLSIQKLAAIPTGVEDDLLPAATIGMQMSSYPNPFSERVNLNITSKQASCAKLSIYNIKGQRVRSMEFELIKGETKVEWDGLDENGRRVANGVYFCRVSTPDKRSITKKLIKLEASGSN